MQSSGILGNADFFTNENKGTYVRITDDKLQAYLYLAEKEDCAPYEVDELVRILVENGVLYGINKSNLVTMTKKEVYHREILVAEADPAEVGSDGYYEFTFDIHSANKNNKPVIREDGSVDYQSMRAVNSVKAGTLLATYHHAIPGKAGKNVCGGEISVPSVRELVPINGRGVCQAKDNPDEYYAEKDGKVEYNAGKLNIVNVLEFAGDVDQLTGKVEFFGDVHIQGNVESGTVIRAGKSLVIGVVEAADLFAGGDIILKRGVTGSQKAHVVGRGNLFADYIEHTFVKTEGNIQANSIVNSFVTTEGKVKLTGKKASLIGGSVYAREGITCNTIGNSSEIKTRAAAGVSEEMYEESERVQRELKEVRHEINMIRSSVTALGNRITPEMQENYKLQLQQKMARQKTLLDDQKKVTERMEAAKDATIQVMGRIYVGAEICIDCNTLKIDKNNNSMEYRNIAGMITGKVMAYKQI